MPFSFTFPFEFSATVADYEGQLKQLLPRGSVWRLDPDSVMSKAMLGIADEFLRLDNRGADLIDESDPRTANEMIADWERVLGLPDDQVPVIPSTIAERRIAVTQKLVNRGGQNNQFFVDLASACGYVVEVSTYNALISTCGRMRSGDRLYGLPWAYSMLVTVDPPAGTALAQADFERIIRHATHAHITVVFEYL